MPSPETSPKPRSSSTSKAAVDAVGRAIGSIHPIVSMWRDGLTVIALESSLDNRAPDYLTFDQATADAAVQIQGAAAQMTELGIPLGGRIHLSVSTPEDRQYFLAALDTRSGPEIYSRVGDSETDGLQQIGTKEWILVAASRPSAEARQ